MLGHFQQILEVVTANPDSELSGIDILTRKEHDQLLKEWNKTEISQYIDKSPDRIVFTRINDNIYRDDHVESIKHKVCRCIDNITPKDIYIYVYDKKM